MHPQKVFLKKLLGGIKKGSKITTFKVPIKQIGMKSSELHRLIKKNGWEHIKTEGSHYIYKKGNRKYPVPYHGSKEIGTGLYKKIIKELALTNV